MIYDSRQKAVYQMPGYYDPDGRRKHVINFKPDVWQPNTVYSSKRDDDYSLVIPTVFRGFYYKAINPGRSHATTEPAFPLTVGETVNDFEAGKSDGLVWEARPYIFLPLDQDIVDLLSISATNDVTIASSSFTTSKVIFMPEVIPPTAAARKLKKFRVETVVELTTGEFIPVSIDFKLSEH